MRSLRRAGLILLWAAVFSVAVAPEGARAERFGRNKVQYKTFEWKIVHTEHFDVYFYEGSEDLADAASLIVEEANADFERVLDHRLSTVIPVIVYASHNDFQQTNVADTAIDETVGGFTELFKNRVVVPFTGSYADLRHVLYHELTHVFMFDIVYGGLVESVVRQAYMNPMPLWFVEGLAEYVSEGWDSEAEMILRDLTVSDRVVPLEYLSGGYLVYKEGQSVINFIADRYGPEKIAEIVRGTAKTHNLDRALKDATGLLTPELSQEWGRWLRAKYWPEVRDRRRPDDIAKVLTDHEADGSFFNLAPEASPDGRKVAFVSDRSGYADIYVASTLDGEILERLVHGERSGDFETLHVLRAGLSWSPDGTEVAFVAKAGASDALHIVDAETGKVRRSLRFPLDGVFTPSWSPSGDRIAFVGTKGGRSDLYVTDVSGEKLEELTDDFFDERDPEWSPDGRRIAFASDRDSPQAVGFARTYDLYIIDVDSRKVDPLISAPGRESAPTWSPDGRYVAYASDESGTPNLYLADLTSGTTARVTDLVGGAASPSWSRGGNRLVFAVYGNAGWDIASVKDPLSAFADAARTSGWSPAIVPLPAVVSAPEEATSASGDTTALAGGAERPEAQARLAEEQEPPAIAEGGSAVPPEAEAGTAPPAESDAVRRARDAYRTAAEGTEYAKGDEAEERHPGTVERYKPRFSPDWLSGGFSYSSGYGFSGAAEIAVSDILGNHRFYLASDFFSSIESSNFYGVYEHLANRVNYSIGIYNFKEYYYSERTQLGEDLGEKRYFTERSYGVSAGLAYPMSKFTRVELDLSALTVDRRFAEENEEGQIQLTDEGVKRSLFIPSVRLVNDTTLWGEIGPLGGGRSSIVLSRAWEPQGGFEYLTAIADVRRYARIGTRHSLALRLLAARSSMENAQTFYMGGVNTLRGFNDFEFRGHNLAVASIEFRYPFIDRLEIASPIPIAIWGLRGVAFMDAGAAWDESFRGVRDDGGRRLKDLKASIGVGVRMRLAFLVLRLDRAWPTDFRETGAGKTHFALGAEF